MQYTRKTIHDGCALLHFNSRIIYLVMFHGGLFNCKIDVIVKKITEKARCPLYREKKNIAKQYNIEGPME